MLIRRTYYVVHYAGFNKNDSHVNIYDFNKSVFILSNLCSNVLPLLRYVKKHACFMISVPFYYF